MKVWPVACLLLLVPAASAHDDRSVADASIRLAPGDSVQWTRDVHWHRLMGTIDSSQPVELTVTGPGGTSHVATGTSLRISHLIECCDAVWTLHTITLTNTGDAPAQVQVDLALLHDNLAVLAHDAEPGGWWQTLLIVALMIGVPAWRARQPRIEPEAAPHWLRRSRIAHGATWGAALLLAAIGMMRFGTGPLTGSLGATQPVPWGVGGFLNTHSLVMLGLMGGWGAAVAFWAGARRRSGSARSHRLDGWMLGAGSLLVGVVLGIESGVWPIPLALGLLPAVALLADSWAPSHQKDSPAPA